MAEFQLGGRAYRSRLLNAADQWALLQRLRPILPALSSLGLGTAGDARDLRTLVEALGPLARASDDDMGRVFETCQGACEVLDGKAWGPLTELPRIADLLRMIAIVVADNFAPFFALERASFRPTLHDGAAYAPAAMPNGDDWLFQPVVRGLCKAESLFDGTLRIEHLARLNDCIAVVDENERRARKAAEKR